jgi:hypothetical protein
VRESRSNHWGVPAIGDTREPASITVKPASICSYGLGGPTSTSTALVPVARSIMVIVWHLLLNPLARVHDLGPDYHTRHIATERRMRNHIAQLTAMGFRVTLEPAV